MNNDLKNFLEGENEKFKKYGLAPDSYGFLDEDECADWLKDHDTRLINFVLDLVEKEVEKNLEIAKKDFDGIQYLEWRQGFYKSHHLVSIIIKNLRV